MPASAGSDSGDVSGWSWAQASSAGYSTYDNNQRIIRSQSKDYGKTTPLYQGDQTEVYFRE